MKKLTAFKGEVTLEDSYCRIKCNYYAEKEDNVWDVRFNLLQLEIISMTAAMSQSVDLKPWQMERAIELLESQLIIEAFKDIDKQKKKELGIG